MAMLVITMAIVTAPIGGSRMPELAPCIFHKVARLSEYYDDCVVICCLLPRSPIHCLGSLSGVPAAGLRNSWHVCGFGFWLGLWHLKFWSVGSLRDVPFKPLGR